MAEQLPGPRPDEMIPRHGAVTTLFRRVILSEYFVLILTIVYFLAVWAFVPWLGRPRNLLNITSNVWPLLAVAVGQTFVLIVAGIDLSQVAVMSLTSVVGAGIMTQALDPVLFTKSPLWGWFLTESGGPLSGSPLAIPVAVVAMIAVAALIGAINGFSVGTLRMPAFMVTLVMFMLGSAVAVFLPRSENIRSLPAAFNAIEDGWGIFSPAMGIAILWTIIAHIILSRTLLGRWMYAVGLNERTARVSGVPTRRVIVFAYSFSAASAAVGAMLYTARMEAGRPTLGGLSLILDIVGANIIGGMSLTGGRGKIPWTVFGVVFFVVLANTLSQMNLDSFSIDIVRGCVILLAALLDVSRNRMKEARS